MNTLITIFFTAVITYYITITIKFFEDKIDCVVDKDNNSSCSINYSTNDLKINRINSSNIIINGKTYSGQTINTINGKLMVDNTVVETPNNFIFNIEIQGDVGTVNLGIGDIKITGSVNKDVKNGQGDIHVTNGNIGGNATTGQGDIEITGTLNGNAKTGMGTVIINK